MSTCLEGGEYGRGRLRWHHAGESAVKGERRIVVVKAILALY